ncbi:MAG: hypothetical protein IH945_09455 [Armatimonadetes bacterium]|nr:hypothetical protein [Armatimonadota bacterium]
MPGIYENAIVRLAALAEANWTDATDFSRVTQLRRFNWREFITDGLLVPPFGIIQTASMLPADEFGPTNRTWRLGVMVHYVRDFVATAAEDAAQQLIEDSIVAQALSLAKAVYENDVADTFQCTAEPSIDASEESPANLVFHDLGSHLYAVSVSASLVIGETA